MGLLKHPCRVTAAGNADRKPFLGTPCAFLQVGNLFPKQSKWLAAFPEFADETVLLRGFAK